MLSDIGGLQLDYHAGGDVGPALGAARHRSANCTVNKQTPARRCIAAVARWNERIIPMRSVMRFINNVRETFRRLYQQLLPLMS